MSSLEIVFLLYIFFSTIAFIKLALYSENNIIKLRKKNKDLEEVTVDLDTRLNKLVETYKFVLPRFKEKQVVFCNGEKYAVIDFKLKDTTFLYTLRKYDELNYLYTSKYVIENIPQNEIISYEQMKERIKC